MLQRYSIKITPLRSSTSWLTKSAGSAVPPPLKTKPGAGPRHIAFHPSGPWCYLLNELDSTLSVCAFDGDDGRLEELQTEACLPAGFTDTNYASDVKVLPSGRFLYTTNRGHDSIAVFAVDGYTGRVEFVSHEEAQGSWPWNLGIDPTVGFLLATNYESDRVSVFRIDPETGALTPTQSQASVPKPTCVAMLAR